jgi:hypothetical protein
MFFFFFRFSSLFLIFFEKARSWYKLVACLLKCDFEFKGRDSVIWSYYKYYVTSKRLG